MANHNVAVTITLTLEVDSDIRDSFEIEAGSAKAEAESLQEAIMGNPNAVDWDDMISYSRHLVVKVEPVRA